MSEIMTPMPFSRLIEWMMSEYRATHSVFGVPENKFYKPYKGVTILGQQLGSPLGPAAGPNTQLAQNLVASYVAGFRFMELKTVQIMDGEELRRCIPRPCINAQDEGYNCEWSTELTVRQAFEEYVKGWFAVHAAMKEFGLAETSDFLFNMSVGYDFEGITSPKIDAYINDMADARQTDIFAQCAAYLKSNLSLFDRLTAGDIDGISPHISSSITLSTLHGCPPQEIEKIAHYFLTVKKMDTFIKVNPTLLGYEAVRGLLDSLGYGYIAFDGRHFEQDLKFGDAVALISRLKGTAKRENKAFGVKVSNTFPVMIKDGELPGEFMYMSGRALFPLSINVAARLARHFHGGLPISYSGGADFFNIRRILETGIRPVTFATTILKPGGYARAKQLCAQAREAALPKEHIDVTALDALAASVVSDAHSRKDARPVKSRKTASALPLFDCFKAPCQDGGCPIEQQIPGYLQLVARGDYAKAFEIIAIDNAAPAVTAQICSHACQSKCTRIDYDSPLQVRNAKKLAADNAQRLYIESMQPAPLKTDKKAAVIGAGPAGIAAGLFLRRNGVAVTVFEKRAKPFGIVQYVIPAFRVPQAAIDADYEMAVKAGVEFRFNAGERIDIDALKKSFDYIILAVGAWKRGECPVKTGGGEFLDALEFLEQSKASACGLDIGRTVAVIGGGDVAMDCARAAKRAPGVEAVSIVYRRTQEFMPAEAEEKHLAIADGINFSELLAPVSYENGVLTARVTALGEKDADGRRKAVPTGETRTLAFDTVISAVGARVDTSLFEKLGVAQTSRGYAQLSESHETSLDNVYVAGDCRAGAATIVQAMADSKRIAKDILKKLGIQDDFVRVSRTADVRAVRDAKAVLADKSDGLRDAARCLSCDVVCEVCCEVCPNRANVRITAAGRPQIVHIDGMCNECGNCGIFCPYTGLPYKEKFTVFWDEAGFYDSANKGAALLGGGRLLVRDECGGVFECFDGDGRLPSSYKAVIAAIREKHGYLTAAD